MKAAVETQPVGSVGTPLRLRWQDLFYMTKPSVALLVVVTAVPTMVMASGFLPDPVLAIATLVGTALSAASAAVFNQIIDTDIDARMERTSRRPVASSKLSTSHAAIYGTLLSVFGLSMLWFLATPLAALVALSGNLFYVIIYSMLLKRRTAQNIVIGGAAGAIGPLIGWAAVTNTIGLPAWLLFLVIFLWTPPHFWALAIKYKDDYARANIPMLPVVFGEERTRRDIFLYTLTLFVPFVALYLIGSIGPIILAVGLLLTGVFSWKAWNLYRSHSSELAMNVFHYSCLYLFIFFAALTFEQLASVVIA